MTTRPQAAEVDLDLAPLDQAAKMLGVSTATIRRLQADGVLTRYRIKGARSPIIRCDLNEVRRLLDQSRD